MSEMILHCCGVIFQQSVGVTQGVASLEISIDTKLELDKIVPKSKLLDFRGS